MTPQHESEISRSIFREASDAFFILRPSDLHILNVNPAAQRLTGKRRKELLAMSLPDLVQTEDVGAIRELVQACQSTASFVGSANYLLNVAGGTKSIQLSASRIHTEPDTLALLVVRDVTRQKALEEELQQARRMEAIGRLSAGVAHEFNNLLMIINGYAAVVLDANGEAMTEEMQAIQKAGERAASFTRQLLDFGSNRTPATTVLDLAAVVAAMQNMLVPLLGDSIEVVTRQTPAADGVTAPLLFEADSARIEQLLINLAVNARDAMPAGGRLTIEMLSVQLTADEAAELHGLAQGPHVVLRVADSGAGMSAETVARAFEPFFSTKGHGQGSGLGLAMVYSAVAQCKGHIGIDSHPGRGTTFTMHFPATDRTIDVRVPSAEARAPISHGSGRVLLVEDDASVRALVSRVLENSGFTVMSFESGADALRESEQHRGKIDLVLTDYLMPGMRGDELGRRLAEQRPGIRVLYMSGCISLDGLGEIPAQMGAVLQKPFSPQELVQRVRAELDH